jgi:hypothetical protein
VPEPVQPVLHPVIRHRLPQRYRHRAGHHRTWPGRPGFYGTHGGECKNV